MATLSPNHCRERIGERAEMGQPVYTAMEKQSVYYGDTSFHSLEIKG